MGNSTIFVGTGMIDGDCYSVSTGPNGVTYCFHKVSLQEILIVRFVRNAEDTNTTATFLQPAVGILKKGMPMVFVRAGVLYFFGQYSSYQNPVRIFKVSVGASVVSTHGTGTLHKDYAGHCVPTGDSVLDPVYCITATGGNQVLKVTSHGHQFVGSTYASGGDFGHCAYMGGRYIKCAPIDQNRMGGGIPSYTFLNFDTQTQIPSTAIENGYTTDLYHSEYYQGCGILSSDLVCAPCTYSINRWPRIIRMSMTSTSYSFIGQFGTLARGSCFLACVTVGNTMWCPPRSSYQHVVLRIDSSYAVSFLAGGFTNRHYFGRQPSPPNFGCVALNTTIVCSPNYQPAYEAMYIDTVRNSTGIITIPWAYYQANRYWFSDCFAVNATDAICLPSQNGVTLLGITTRPETTAAPTNNPTVNPTLTPSTVSPSTVCPATLNPTLNPATAHPLTANPSVSPATLAPTLPTTASPTTSLPTASPTTSPSSRSLAPTLLPTGSPTAHPGTTSPSSPVAVVHDNVQEAKGASADSSGLVIIIVTLLVGTAACLALWFWLASRRKRIHGAVHEVAASSAGSLPLASSAEMTDMRSSMRSSMVAWGHNKEK
eukprot:jgi/Bigna1/78355/fgenesh1_pg.54_\